MSTILQALFWRVTLIKAVRTAAQAALGCIGSDVVGVLEVDWLAVVSVSAMSALACVLMCVAQSDVPSE